MRSNSPGRGVSRFNILTALPNSRGKLVTVGDTPEFVSRFAIMYLGGSVSVMFRY